MLNKMLVMTWEAWRAQVEARRVAMAGCAAMCARAIGREHLAALLFWRDCAQRSMRGEQIRAILGDKVQAISLYLPFISPISRLYLPCILQARTSASTPTTPTAAGRSSRRPGRRATTL